LSETCALLEWMENRHFTFLGYREYRLQGRKAGKRCRRSSPRGSASCGRVTERPRTRRACCRATSGARAAHAA
jgi:NAD-specific glutamate dehydrogenase